MVSNILLGMSLGFAITSYIFSTKWEAQYELATYDILLSGFLLGCAFYFRKGTP